MENYQNIYLNKINELLKSIDGKILKTVPIIDFMEGDMPKLSITVNQIVTEEDVQKILGDNFNVIRLAPNQDLQDRLRSVFTMYHIVIRTSTCVRAIHCTCIRKGNFIMTTLTMTDTGDARYILQIIADTLDSFASSENNNIEEGSCLCNTEEIENMKKEIAIKLYFFFERYATNFNQAMENYNSQEEFIQYIMYYLNDDECIDIIIDAVNETINMDGISDNDRMELKAFFYDFMEFLTKSHFCDCSCNGICSCPK